MSFVVEPAGIEACYPVTCAAILRFSPPAKHLVVVGVVTAEEVGHIFHDLIVDDTTGRIRVRCIRQASTYTTYLGTYVRAVGQVVESLNFQLLCKQVRAVEGADEISYHQIEAALCYLRKLNHGVASTQHD